MPVKYLPWITRDMLRNEPEAMFVFGDNMERWGLGGQAKEMRGEPNAIGVATLYAPGRFYNGNDPLALSTVANDLFIVSKSLALGMTVYVPTDGLGTGLGRLKESAPLINNFIVAFFKAAPGETCPWEN